ncbi:MAG TPA: GAF domain-containing sensor histidine kinase [Solirubrobacteraceae bacterium]|nr:GAF domain-containing sensor histidine kinase [Solirubrobacteraceae bacterium]
MDQATREVLEVARGVLEQLDTEQVLERVLDAARELTGARYAALGVLDEPRNALARFLTRGIDDHERQAIGALPTGRGVLGELIRNPRSLRMADVGSHPYSYGFPVGHPPMSSFLGVPIMVRGEPYGNLYLTEKQDGGEFTDEDEEAAGLLADFAGVAIDHARRFTSSEEHGERLQRTVDALDATIQIARAIGGETDLDSILSLVAKRGRALVSARVLVIELLRGDELEMAAGAGAVPAELIGRRVPLDNTIASAALRAGRTQRLSDRLMRARFEQHGAGHLGVDAEHALIVPLVFRNQQYGVLVAIDHLDDGEFSAEHQNLLEAFAASAATAVATAQSAADERRRQRLAAAEVERSRWARELHDETLQALGNLRLMLAGARRSGDPALMAGAVDQALDQLELDITTLRALITELRPAALDQLGLEPALMALLDRTRRGGLEVEAEVALAFERDDARERLASELETGVYRIVQEALTNAGKHGAATSVVVGVVEDNGQVRIGVRDDGRGFDPSAATAGFGLAGMRERVELLGGELALTSAPGQGTTVAVTLPVQRRDADEGAAVPPSVVSGG